MNDATTTPTAFTFADRVDAYGFARCAAEKGCLVSRPVYRDGTFWVRCAATAQVAEWAASIYGGVEVSR